MIARAPRRRVNIPARMRAGGAPVSVCVRDISPRSMLIEAAAVPPSGTFVEIVGPRMSIAGQVIWSRSSRFAVRTRERLDVDAAVDDLGSLRPSGEKLPGSRPPPAKTFGLRPARDPDPQQQGERSRLLGRRIQYTGLAACVALAAALVAGVSYQTVSDPVGRVVAALRPDS